MTQQVHDPEEDQYAPCPHCRYNVGVGVASDWHQRKGPGPLLATRHSEDWRSWRPRWVDHSWRYRRQDNRWTYVAEPYDLDEDALEDLAYLIERGYSVEVTAWKARHYPGHTLAVEITKGVGT